MIGQSPGFLVLHINYHRRLFNFKWVILLSSATAWKRPTQDMEWFNLALLSALFIVVLKSTLHKFSKTRKNLPPSPPARFIIGHLHLLKQPIHRTLHELSKKYGDILFLRFGTRKVLVISSPSLAEECFTKNDITFANRPRTLAGKYLNYNSTTMGFASYCDHWRKLRRFTTIELLSSTRLAMFSDIRNEEVRLLLKDMFHDSTKGLSKVELTTKLSELTFNIVMRMIAGKRYYGKDVDKEEARRFQEIIKEMESLRGSLNLNDYFPVLQWIDYKGVEKRMRGLGQKMDRLLQDLVEERQRERTEISDDQKSSMTFIDVMLSLREAEPDFYTDQTIKGVVQSMLTAGTQTSAAAMEWAMSLLLSHPKTMEKAVKEIDDFIGQDHLIEEREVPKLSYLQNIINETLRLFPPAPLLLPHQSSMDCTVSGFDVPRGTTLLVNTWSIGRDPKVWEEPTKFMPERFESGEGENYKLLPFGAGRRACPGAGMARKVISLTLGALLQSFVWETVSKEEINMAEATGLTMPKAEPLEVLCLPRKALIKLLSDI